MACPQERGVFEPRRRWPGRRGRGIAASAPRGGRGTCSSGSWCTLLSSGPGSGAALHVGRWGVEAQAAGSSHPEGTEQPAQGSWSFPS